jgi:hypothetical protein
MSDSVVVIVSAFFIIGITAGVIAVIALSVLRAHRAADPGDPGDLPGYGPRGTGRQPPDPGFQDDDPADESHWPGDADSDFSR